MFYAPPGRRPWPRSKVGLGVAPPGCRPWPRTWGSSSWPPPLGHGVLPASAPDLGRGVVPLGCTCTPSQLPALNLGVCNISDFVSSCGFLYVLEKEMATHSSILVWKTPWTEKLGRLQSMGSRRVGHDWATSLSFTLFILLCVFRSFWIFGMMSYGFWKFSVLPLSRFLKLHIY